MELMKSEVDQQRKDIFKKHLSSCLNDAGFLKLTIADKKKAMMQNADIAPCNQPIGLKCLGSNYIMAYEWYMNLGDYYFKMATDKGFLGVLPAV